MDLSFVSQSDNYWWRYCQKITIFTMLFTPLVIYASSLRRRMTTHGKWSSWSTWPSHSQHLVDASIPSRCRAEKLFIVNVFIIRELFALFAWPLSGITPELRGTGIINTSIPSAGNLSTPVAVNKFTVFNFNIIYIILSATHLFY